MPQYKPAGECERQSSKSVFSIPLGMLSFPVYELIRNKQQAKNSYEIQKTTIST